MKPTATIISSCLCKTNLQHRFRPNPSLFYFPGLTSKPLWIFDTNKSLDDYNFQAIESKLSSNHSIIIKEYQQLRGDMLLSSDYGHGDKVDHKLHQGKWDWNSYILKGKPQEQFMKSCPKTVEILESLSTINSKIRLMKTTPFSFAFFSTLFPQSRIQAHYGPCNIRLRCHYSLIIPKSNQNIGMRIGDEIVQWTEKKAIFFDDCYEHEG